MGGCKSDVVSRSCVDVGGEVGGVSNCCGAGRGPGEQCGICLLGIAEGVPRWDVLMFKWPGGGVLRPGSGAGRARMVAMRAMQRATGGVVGGVYGGDAGVVREVNGSRGQVVEAEGSCKAEAGCGLVINLLKRVDGAYRVRRLVRLVECGWWIGCVYMTRRQGEHARGRDEKAMKGIKQCARSSRDERVLLVANSRAPKCQQQQRRR